MRATPCSDPDGPLPSRDLLLLERYLPFNDRRLLPPPLYTAILFLYIEARDYRGLHARVSRWPVYYDVDRLIARIKAELETLGLSEHEFGDGTPAREVEGDDADADSDRSVFVFLIFFGFGFGFLEKKNSLNIYI